MLKFMSRTQASAANIRIFLFVALFMLFQVASTLLSTPSAAAQSVGSYFKTLPPGSTLPTEKECASRVRRSSWEPRPENDKANHTLPKPFTQDYSKLGPMDDKALKTLLPRISGNFTGTTDEIIQWAACKWGFNENIVRAVAAKESDWKQSFVGDKGESYGLMQVKRTYVPFTYPNSQISTAFNVDYALGIRRACYEGSITFLKDGYKAGDEWGCIGYWFSGGWYDLGAKSYIKLVKDILVKQNWNQYGAGAAPTPKES